MVAAINETEAILNSRMTEEASLNSTKALVVGFVGLVFVFAPQLLFKAPLFLVWTMLSAFLAVLQGLYVSYQLVMIVVSLCMLAVLLATRRAYSLTQTITRARPAWLRVLSAMNTASSWQEYVELAEKMGAIDEWQKQEEDMPCATLLRSAMADLKAALDADDETQRLRFALSGLTKRNHLGIEAARWYPAHSATGTKLVIDEYLGAVTDALRHVADSDAVSDEEKTQFLNRVRRTVGVTALCLSGGGATTMFHGGHLLGLIEAGLYDQIHVVSGTSGGSIMAAMMGCKTKEEMVRDVLVPWVSTDFTRDGEQKRRKLRFFPPLWRQMLNFARTRVLVDSAAFKRTCDFYWGDVTFQEAHERTGKVLCISVSAQRADGRVSDSVQRLLMNHITTPHVTLASAVAASCALPGILRPMRLEAKDANGVVAPFEVDGVSWVDGSIQADTPFRRMATLFNVSNFIVCQVNFHVRLVVEDSSSPFHVGGAHSAWGANVVAAYNRLFRGAELSIRMRATMLSKLGLMPSLYGNDIGKVFSQKYHGDVTIAPKFTYLQSIGLSAIINPTVQQMTFYLDGGKRAVWPHVSRIKRMLVLENCLADCWQRIRAARRHTSKLQLSRHAESDPLSDDEHDNVPSGNSALAGPPRFPRSSVKSPVGGADASKSHSAAAEARYHQLEWEYRRLQTRFERLRSENLDLRRRLEDIRNMCAPVEGPDAQ